MDVRMELRCLYVLLQYRDNAMQDAVHAILLGCLLRDANAAATLCSSLPVLAACKCLQGFNASLLCRLMPRQIPQQ